MSPSYGLAFIGPEGFVEMEYVGHISEEVLSPILVDTDRLIEQVLEQGRSPMLLVNITQLSQPSHGARQLGIEWVKGSKVTRISVYGHNLPMKYLFNFIAKAIGWKERYRFFKTRQQAVRWLQKSETASGQKTP